MANLGIFRGFLNISRLGFMVWLANKYFEVYVADAGVTPDLNGCGYGFGSQYGSANSLIEWRFEFKDFLRSFHKFWCDVVTFGHNAALRWGFWLSRWGAIFKGLPTQSQSTPGNKHRRHWIESYTQLREYTHIRFQHTFIASKLCQPLLDPLVQTKRSDILNGLQYHIHSITP